MANQVRLNDDLCRKLSSLSVGDYAPPSGFRKYYDLYFFDFYRFLTEYKVDEEFFSTGLPKILAVFEKDVQECRTFLDEWSEENIYITIADCPEGESPSYYEFLAAVSAMTRVKGFDMAYPKICSCFSALYEVYRDRLVDSDVYFGKCIQEVLRILKN